MKRLDKDQTRKRWTELQALWNAYDPIGVMADGTASRQEYETYVGPMLGLLEAGAPVPRIVRYLYSVNEQFGLEFDSEEAIQFAVRVKNWFQFKWDWTRLNRHAPAMLETADT